MGTVYALLNKTKKESVYIDNIPQKFFELMNKKYSNFVTWMLLYNWLGDHVVFVSDNNSSEFCKEFYGSEDKSEEYWNDFNNFINSNSWYFESDNNVTGGYENV